MENQQKELEAKIEKYTRISVMTMVFSIIAVIVILVFTAFLNNLLYYIPIFSYLVINTFLSLKFEKLEKKTTEELKSLQKQILEQELHENYGKL